MPRVISGTAKGRRLKSAPGDTTRPILDRVKENLFNILGDWIVDTTWLDLFAGTGQVGIEALSRGAAHCLFLDMDKTAVEIVKENLALTNLTEYGEVRRVDSFRFLENGRVETPFEYIFVAPPQYKGLWLKAVELIDKREGLLAVDGVVIVQIDPKEAAELSLERLTLADRREYGRTLLLFFTLPGE